MPNHIHLIVLLNDNLMKAKVDGMSRTPSPTNYIIPRLISTFKRFVNKEIGVNVWQRSYHDHVIRGEKDFQMIWEYVDNNPISWADDVYNKNQK